MPRLTAPFTISDWTPAAPGTTPWPSDALPALGRASFRKTYTGALDGTAAVEMLTCLADPADMARGAVYSALEQVTGTLDGRTGSVVFVHAATSGDGAEGIPAGTIAPGSGTGDLAGIRGTLTIDPGSHVLTLDYTLPEGP